MTSLWLAAACFAALHLLVSGTSLRDALVARIGERPYMGLFSLGSVGLLGWLVHAYGKVRPVALTPFLSYRWIAVALMLVAFLFIVLGLATPSPTAVGGEKRLDQDDPARGIQRITRHPFLWGMTLWAAVHLVFNPGLPHLAFFGCFAIVSLLGTASIDAKRARRFGAKWQRYAAVTSNLPFVAIAQGRNRLPGADLGWGRLAAAVAAFVVVLMLHARLFGVPPV